MKDLTYFLFFIFFISCSGNRQVNQALLPELDEMDYEVISAAIDLYLDKYKRGSYPEGDSSFYEGTGNRLPLAVLIPDSTGIEYLSNWTFDQHKDKGFNDKYLTDRMKPLNKRKYKIDQNKITSIKTYSDKDVANSKNYEEIYKLYPDIWGFINFSKPSLNIEENVAVIYITFFKAGLWGEANYLWLKKENGKWVIYDNRQLWIS